MSSGVESGDERFERVVEELATKILSGQIDRDDLENEKNRICGKHSSPKVPKNSTILDAVPEERRGEVREVLKTTPVRTSSGVSPVAVMTSPEWCPHGKCVFCPGGPDSEFEAPMSYTGNEPASMRGEHHDYHPYDQVYQRLTDLRETGHLVDKVELILMGGTMSARPHDYQEWFVKRCLQAMNRFTDPDEEDVVKPRNDSWMEFEKVLERNREAGVRNIGTTFETKPDWCGKQQVDRMLRLGGTKVEMGVQTTDDETLRKTHRGHGVEETLEANRRLHDAGFKVGFHMMPGMPGRTPEDDVRDFDVIFDDPSYRPDYLKIYPTLVVRDTGLYEMWHNNDFSPLDNEDAAEVVAKAKKRIPRYTRLSRVQRDIPATEIEVGVWKSNLRQIARRKLSEIGGECDCIRCREVGLRDDPSVEDVELEVMEYECAGGTEYFLEYRDVTEDHLIGFLRLRFPGETVRSELRDAAIVRELHVYGTEVGVGSDGQEFQHSGYGEKLLREAESLTRDAGYGRLAVISGIGVMEYYADRGYVRDGPYMVQDF
ncbi:MAG: tRNA uridine(34) 5-carboxymethylaminomethyl modification radical SAM/GNAT enzyme Elp3 [Halobacteria archaeon]